MATIQKVILVENNNPHNMANLREELERGYRITIVAGANGSVGYSTAIWMVILEKDYPLPTDSPTT